MTISKARLYGESDFSLLCEQSLVNDRLRQHHNIHSDYSDPCQRLFIAMQPRSFVVPHRHTSPAKTETFIVLRGCIGLVFFDDKGQIESSELLGPNCKTQICDISPGIWHTAIALERDSIFMEVKRGPYSPVEAIDIALWSPIGDGIQGYLDTLYSHFEQTSQSKGSI